MDTYFPGFAKFITGLILIIFITAPAQAVEPVVHILPKPAWLSSYKPYSQMPSLRTVEDGYFFELIEHQVQVEKQADYHHCIRRIVSETGIQDGSEINVSFDPSYEQLNFHDIIVWRDNKPQNRLKASAFKIVADEKDLSNFIYQGTYSAICILADIRKGDRIEYSYTISGRNPVFNNKYSNFLYFQWFQTVAHQYTSLIFSSGRKINMKLFNDAAKPIVTKANGSTKYEWENFQLKPAAYNENEPGWFDARSYAQISDYSNWGEVTNWALSINTPKNNVKGELAIEIARLKSISGDDKEKYFRNAVKTVQDEVRYMGIEIGPYSHRANDPQKVFAQRYGDCKDKSLLLVTMLRANGIDANMVLVNSDGGDISQYLPAHNVFDHAVVVAQVNNKSVWVDATMDYQRGTGTNIYFPDYGKGLILKAGNAGLTTIPQPKTGKITCAENFTVKDERSPVKLEVITTYTLDQADKIRDRLASAGMAETEKNYLKYYAATYSKIESADSVVVKDDQQNNTLTTIEKYRINDFLKKDSTTGSYAINFYAECIKEQLPNVNSQTKTPVDVAYPFNEDYTVRLVLPTSWDITARTYAINRDGYRFSSNYSTSGDTLSLNYKFAYLKSFIPADKLDEFKQDIKDLVDNKLYYAINYTPAGTVDEHQSGDLNLWMLNLVLFIVLILFIASFFIYRSETPGIAFSYGSDFIPVGGWLIVVALILFFTPLATIIKLINDNYFSMSAWDSFDNVHDGLVHKSLIVFEAAANTTISCYSVFCLVLLLNKRDILPRYIIGFFILTAACWIIDCVAFVLIHNTVPSETFITYGIKTIIFVCIWVPYFLRSTRVEETFIVPYPPDNYIYDPPPGTE